MTEVDLDQFNAFERQGWAENSVDAYERFFGPATGQVIDDLLDAAGVTQGTRLLDVATGPGYVASRARARGAQVLGVDLSPQMLERARQGHPTIEFRQADAENLDLPAGRFDAVVANFCLLHVGRPERVVCGMARLLAPGGRMALTVWGPPERARLFGLVPEALRAAGASTPAEIPPGPDFFRFAADPEFARLLASAGLGRVSVRTIEFTHRVLDIDHLWSGMLEGSVRTRALLRWQDTPTRRRIYTELGRLLEAYRREGGFDVPVSVKLASGVADERPTTSAVDAR